MKKQERADLIRQRLDDLYPDPPIPLHIGLGWKKSHYLSKASRAFLEFMQQQL